MPRRAQSVPKWIVAAIAASVLGLACRAADPPPAAPPVLSLDAAIRFALETNPQLAAMRTQRGIAAAGVVLAKIYPHNPQVEATVLRASGPESAGITNHVFNEIIVSQQLEIRGQRRKRIAAACAALTRTEWEIAGQELTTAINVIRTYNTLLYRQQ
jgi:outer membrane protein TolC